MVIPKEYLTFSYTCVPVMDPVEGDTNTADPMPLGSCLGLGLGITREGPSG